MNNEFKLVEPEQLTDNSFKLVGKDWMLITAGNIEKYNMMTASWGGFGVLWNKKVCFCFVRPSRYTYQFMEENDTFTLSFFEEDYRKALSFCGANSGRDVDKAALQGLHPLKARLDPSILRKLDWLWNVKNSIIRIWTRAIFLIRQLKVTISRMIITVFTLVKSFGAMLKIKFNSTRRFNYQGRHIFFLGVVASYSAECATHTSVVKQSSGIFNNSPSRKQEPSLTCQNLWALQ